MYYCENKENDELEADLNSHLIKVLDLKQRGLTADELSKLDKKFKSAHENYRYDSKRKDKSDLEVHLSQHDTSIITRQRQNVINNSKD